MQRLDDMGAANSLADTALLPGHFHVLKGDRAGQWSADLKHPLRLIFEPADEPLPLLKDNTVDPSRVRTVRIIEVEDTHE